MGRAKRLAEHFFLEVQYSKWTLVVLNFAKSTIPLKSISFNYQIKQLPLILPPFQRAFSQEQFSPSFPCRSDRWQLTESEKNIKMCYLSLNLTKVSSQGVHVLLKNFSIVFQQMKKICAIQLRIRLTGNVFFYFHGQKMAILSTGSFIVKCE